MDFSFLNKKINILAVDDEPFILKTFQKLLDEYPPYKVSAVSTIQDAERLILDNNRYHVCLMDLGLYSTDNDEFYLLRKYHTKMPFIIITGSNSFEKGVKVNKLGAFNAMSKGALDIMEIIHRVNKTVIKGMFLKRCNFNDTAMFNKAFDLIFNNESISIHEIAHTCLVSESNLQKLWKRIFDLSPKKVLMMLKILRLAFDHFNRIYAIIGKSEENGDSSVVVEEKTIKLRNYYSMYKDPLCEYLR